MVATSDLLKGMTLWILAMLMPLLTTYVTNGTFRLAVLTFVYPIMIAFLARSGRFWVSQTVIVLASAVALGMALLLRLSPQARDAIDNPDKNKSLSGIIIASIITVFFIVMGVASMGLGMYGANVNVE